MLQYCATLLSVVEYCSLRTPSCVVRLELSSPKNGSCKQDDHDGAEPAMTAKRTEDGEDTTGYMSRERLKQ